MIALYILLPLIIATLFLRRGKSTPKTNGVIKIGERAWIINNKFIDLDNNQLTQEQDFNNRRLDFEIAEAQRHNAHIQLENERKLRAWEEFLKQNPNHPFKACPGIDMTMPKLVIGIKYVK